MTKNMSVKNVESEKRKNLSVVPDVFA